MKETVKFALFHNIPRHFQAHLAQFNMNRAVYFGYLIYLIFNKTLRKHYNVPENNNKSTIKRLFMAL